MLNLASERPLLLAVDDLHWCDRPSLRFLSYLARRLDDVPVLLLTSLRTAEPGTDPALLAELARDSATLSLPLGRLTRHGSAELVRSRLPGAEDRFCAECHDATGGVPLLLRQLVRALEADDVRPVAANASVVRAIGPRAVSRTVLARLVRLSPEAVAVARAVAVLGEGAPLPYVAAYAGLPGPAVAEAAGALARAEILRTDGPLGFVHALVRHAVYDELAEPVRDHEHGRAAALLRRRGGRARGRGRAAPARLPGGGSVGDADARGGGSVRHGARRARRRGHLPQASARGALSRGGSLPPPAHAGSHRAGARCAAGGASTCARPTP